MNKLEYCLQIVNSIRREKNPPLGRYCLLLALANSDKPLTSHQVALALGDNTYGSGTLSRAVDHGLINEHSPANGRGKTYSLTPLGIKEVRMIACPTLPESTC
jgi:hypothetical protein